MSEVCNTNQVEDEVHFICQCIAYTYIKKRTMPNRLSTDFRKECEQEINFIFEE